MIFMYVFVHCTRWMGIIYYAMDVAGTTNDGLEQFRGELKILNENRKPTSAPWETI